MPLNPAAYSGEVYKLEIKIKEREKLIKEAENKFKKILNWHHPNKCEEPLKEYLKELENA